MPDIKISDLTAATAASGAMQVEVNDSGSSKKVTVEQIKAYVLPADSITATEIAADAVGSSEIAAGAVGTSELADSAVTSIKLADSAVTSIKLATDSVTADKIAAGAVGSSELAASGVTAGSYGGATSIPVITVDEDGRISSASSVAVSSGVTKGAAIFTTSTSWSVPPGVTSVRVYCYGGGGGGGKAGLTSNIGGVGGYADALVTLGSESSVTITVGSGGAYASTGGTSSFGGYVSATGGTPGSTSTAGASGSPGNGYVYSGVPFRRCAQDISNTGGMGPINGVGSSTTDNRVFSINSNAAPGDSGQGSSAPSSYGSGGVVFIEW